MNDSEWNYSNDALNVLDSFYDRKIIMYVEGNDDILFWQFVLNKFGNLNPEIYPVFSSCELDKMIKKILDGEIIGIAGRDADYLRFSNTNWTDPRVLLTAGHSIENCLLNEQSVFQMTKSWCKSLRTSAEECKAWLLDFAATFRQLLVLEVANMLQKNPTAVMGDNCSQFMKSKNSAKPCTTKIQGKIDAIYATFDTRVLAEAEGKCPNEPNEILKVIRGHFIESAVQKFITEKIKKHGGKGSISYDGLFASAIQHFEMTLDSTHNSKNYYEGLVGNLLNYLRNNSQGIPAAA